MRPLTRLRAAIGPVLVGTLLAACSARTDASDGAAERDRGGDPRAFYVSPDGDDRNTGTSPATAWQSIERANDGNYRAGDRILFEGGAAFAGELRFTPENAHGQRGDPVAVGSYGEGRAMIESGAGSGVSAVDVGGLHVADLVLIGDGPGNGASGIAFTTSERRLADIAVTRADITGYAYAIFVNAPEPPARYDGVRVEGVVAHGNALGPTFFGALAKPETRAKRYGIVDLEVADSESFDNTGYGLPGGFGGGIAVVDAARVRIHDNVIHDNGGDNPPAAGSNGPMGIALYGGRDVVVERNEVFHQRFYPPEPTDSGGIDVWAEDAVIQHNFVHDNEGWGIVLGSAAPGSGSTWFGRDTTVRYNVIENNGRLLPRDERLPPVMGAGILMFGPVENYDIYNNALFARAIDGVEGDTRQGLIYLVDVPPAPPWSQVHIRNNLFVAPDDVSLVEVPRPSAGDDLRLEGNAYVGGSSTRPVVWGDETYQTVEAWSAASGQETVDGVLRAVVAGFDVLCGGEGVGATDPGAYVPSEGSPLVDAGLDLRELAGLEVGTRDFVGRPIPAGGAYDIGPNEHEPGSVCE